MIWPLTLLPRFDGHPQSTNLRFDGLKILITAASGGIGLAAAKDLASRGPSLLIVTARDDKKALATKTAIYEHVAALNIKTPPEVLALALEMTDAVSIRAFIKFLQSHTKHLDHAILNAGMITQKPQLSPSTDYDVVIQVNAISTIYLALQLLPLLLVSPLTTQPAPEQRPHLTFVSSGSAWRANLHASPPASISPDTSTPLADLSKPTNFPPGTFGGSEHYARSKLMLEHAMRRLAFLPLLNDPQSTVPAAPDPLVLVSSVCPGPTGSDLARNFTEKSVVMSALVWLILLVVRPAEVGANIYVSGLGKGTEVRGEMWRDDIIVAGDKLKNVKSEEGLKMGESVWAEMKEILKRMDEGGDGTVARMLG